MKKIFILSICCLARVHSNAQFFIQSSLSKSRITAGDYTGTGFSVGLGYNLSEYFSVSVNYETTTASAFSNAIGDLKSNDSVIITAAFHSQPTNLSQQSVYNIYDYHDALAVLKEKPDRITYSSFKAGIDYNPFPHKKHEFHIGLQLGISRIVENKFVLTQPGVFTPTFGIPENVIIVTPYFSNILDISINPALKYYYHISPTLSLGCTLNVDYFYYSGDYNWNYGIASIIRLHNYRK